MKTLTIDPVCGMEVPTSSRFHVEHAGTTYLFCCERCRNRFKRDPGEFIYPEGGELEALVRNLEVHLHESESTVRGCSSGSMVLFLIPGFAALVACAMQWPAGPRWDWSVSIRDFTGLVLIFLSAFKLSEFQAFAETFPIYDFLAKFVRPYAYLYPFLELALGLGFLTGLHPLVFSAVTAGLMIFGALGMLAALRREEIVEWINSGASLKVSLSIATLIANLGVGILAGVICWFGQV